jgi:hypothetical protein
MIFSPSAISILSCARAANIVASKRESASGDVNDAIRFTPMHPAVLGVFPFHRPLEHLWSNCGRLANR